MSTASPLSRHRRRHILLLVVHPILFTKWIGSDERLNRRLKDPSFRLLSPSLCAFFDSRFPHSPNEESGQFRRKRRRSWEHPARGFQTRGPTCTLWSNGEYKYKGIINSHLFYPIQETKLDYERCFEALSRLLFSLATSKQR